MSLLSPTSDFTGEMSQSDLNNQDIQNLQEEITRLQQNQDSINQTLNITAQGKKTVTVTAGASGGFQIPFTTLTANTYLVYAAPSDRPGQFITVPFYEFDNTGILTNRFIANTIGAYTGITPGMTISYQYNANATITFYYFIIQQPANVTL
jgi:hypothetical protein